LLAFLQTAGLSRAPVPKARDQMRKSESVETMPPDAQRHDVCRVVVSSEATAGAWVEGTPPVPYPWVKGTLPRGGKEGAV
jgi:hypothetical protein